MALKFGILIIIIAVGVFIFVSYDSTLMPISFENEKSVLIATSSQTIFEEASQEESQLIPIID